MRAKRKRARRLRARERYLPHRFDELWVIDDDPDWLETIARGVVDAAPGFVVRTFASVADADAALSKSSPAGMLVDERLGKQSGHAWIISRREALLRTHVVLCTGLDLSAAAAMTYLAANAVLGKPISPECIEMFVKRSSTGRPKTVGEVLAVCFESWELSPQQSLLLRLTADGTRREDLPRRMKVTANTVKHHIKALNRKSGHGHLSDVVATLLRQIGGAS